MAGNSHRGLPNGPSDETGYDTGESRDRSGFSRRTLLATTGAGIVGGMFTGFGSVAAEESGDGAYHLKTRPTLYTTEMRENARQNVQNYDWAASERDSAVSTAESNLDRWGPDLESLWSLITSQKIPRGGGETSERNALGGYSEPGTDRPWKIESAIDNPHGDGNFVFPTNDFAAYRESGLDDRGMFDPDLADDSLLVNEEHPEMGEGWGVDDGWGWHDDNNDLGLGAGNRWNFVAYYNHWFVWRPRGVDDLVPSLADAYLLTGDSKYAVAGLVMLDRIADVYPEMDLTEYTQSLDGFWNNHGGRQTGRVIGGSWETNLVRPLIEAYDALFPALDDEDVADEVLDFLQGRVDEYPGLPAKDSVEAIRENIEENFIMEMLPAAKNSDLVPDRGQRPTIAVSARVQDDVREEGYTREALEWLFQPGGEIFDGDVWDEEPENWNTTGGELLVPVVNDCDRDGYWHEAAQLYNRIQMSSVRQVAEVLQGYDGFDGADLYQHPKLQQALGINSHLVLLDTVFPEIGDTHTYDMSPPYQVSQTGIEDGYHVTGDSYYAQFWHFLNGYSTDGIQGSIFDADPEGLDEEIQSIIDAEGPLDLGSDNLAGYGFAALRDGENYLTVSYGVTHDFSTLFEEASTHVDDSFPEAIQLNADEAGEQWTFAVDVGASDEYDLDVDVLFADTYGIYEVYIDDEHVDTVDFAFDGSGRETLTYTHELAAGTTEIRFENVGRNEDANGYRMALYTLELLDSTDREIRDGASTLGNTKRELWMYYGRNGIEGGGTVHGHRDTLNVGLAANEMELARDLGYPESTGDHPPRRFFTDNTISHNTVVVNKAGQQHHWVGLPRHFDGEDERVNLIDVEAPHVYEETDEYRRAVAWITVDEEHSYAVDFFRVAGGEDHLYSFHGTRADVNTEGLELVPQDGGTLAGEDVPYADEDYNDERIPGWGAAEGAGYNYFDNVSRDADPAEKVSIEWDVEDHFDLRDDNAEGVAMRLTSFGEFDEVAIADGYPPNSTDGATPEPSIPYAFLNRSGGDLESTFVSTIEHYEGDRVVDSVDVVPAVDEDGEPTNARAVRVELTTGRTDYVVCAFDDDTTVVVDDTFEFKGFFGLYSVENGEPEYAYVHDGTHLVVDGESLIQESTASVQAFVEDFTRDISLENELTMRVAGNRGELERHAGFVYVDNDDSNPWRGHPDPEEPPFGRSRRGRGNGAYPIEGLSSGRGNLVTVDVGDKTFTRDFEDPDQLEDGGYRYIIDEDDDVTIPLVSSWSAE
ncbi:heparinase II/III domain-containing protein [Natrononativus amylolyticus]|uniref:heparinase II/III domain-containing protein n=1 Tax=Natrononativus amylolyticus TaxID=2963434 RepID=UPI0020CDDC9C|nr:heparinase II/III family protein [Natrononativus amylolyticus]